MVHEPYNGNLLSTYLNVVEKMPYILLPVIVSKVHGDEQRELLYISPR